MQKNLNDMNELRDTALETFARDEIRIPLIAKMMAFVYLNLLVGGPVAVGLFAHFCRVLFEGSADR